MRSLIWMGAAATAAVMVCVAGAGAGCGGSTFSAASDAGGDGRGGSGSSSGGASSSGGSSGSGSGSSSGGSSSSSSGSGSGGGSSGGGSGSSSGGAVSPCPVTAPANNAVCMQDGLQCEYGTSPNPSCNDIVECLNGTWSGGGNLNCPAGTCPAHYADVPQGGACTPEGLDCAYLDGQCNCSQTSSAGTGTMPTWHCFHPAGCPEPRPRVGDACVQDGLTCDYGACTGGLEETCTDGYWHWTMTPCPG